MAGFFLLSVSNFGLEPYFRSQCCYISSISSGDCKTGLNTICQC